MDLPMKYVFLVYGAEESMSTLPAGAALLRESGHLLATASDDNSVAATVQVRNGALSITDAAVDTTTARPITYFFVSARDLNDAIRLAAKMPQACSGRIEVRSVEMVDQQPFP
jgi:hypothetical protein